MLYLIRILIAISVVIRFVISPSFLREYITVCSFIKFLDYLIKNNKECLQQRKWHSFDLIVGISLAKASVY